MLSRARWYARTQRPGRVESALRGAAWGLLAIWLAQLGAAFAQEAPRQLYVRLAANLPAVTAQRLLSALEAQLADLASIELSEPSAEHALGIVSIAHATNTLSIQFADAQAQSIGAPRVVSGVQGERSASEVASIVRAFVIARLEQPGTRAEPALAATAAPQEGAAPSIVPVETAATPGPAGAATAERQPQSAAAARQSAQVAADPAQRKSQTALTAPQNPGGPPQRQPQTRAQRRKPSQAATTLLAKPPAPEDEDGGTASTAAAAAAARPDADRPAPAASATESWRLRLSALYTGATYAPELPWHDGVRVDASARLRRWFYLGVSYGYQLPADARGQAAHVRLAAHTSYAFFGLGRSWRSFGAALDLGLGATRTLRSTTWWAEALNGTPEEGHWSLLAALRLHGRVRFAALPRLALDVAPALELSPGARAAVAQLDDGGESVVLSPGLVRARLDVGASFDVF
jgi:hypothetical protein